MSMLGGRCGHRSCRPAADVVGVLVPLVRLVLRVLPVLLQNLLLLLLLRRGCYVDWRSRESALMLIDHDVSCIMLSLWLAYVDLGSRGGAAPGPGRCGVGSSWRKSWSPRPARS